MESQSKFPNRLPTSSEKKELIPKVKLKQSTTVVFLSLAFLIATLGIFLNLFGLNTSDPLLLYDNFVSLNLKGLTGQPLNPSQPPTPSKPEKEPQPQPNGGSTSAPEIEPKPTTEPQTPSEEESVLESPRKPKSLTQLKFLKEKSLDREGTSTFLIAGGLTPTKNMRRVTLCRLNVTRNCYTNYIADVIDRAVTILPIYAAHPEKMPLLYELHENFKNMLKTTGLRTIVIEAIMPDRGQTFRATTAGKEPWEIQLHVKDSFYRRENLVNVASRKTFDFWDYMFYIDGHQYFHNLYWWEESIHKLEHYKAIQMATRITYLNRDNSTTYYDGGSLQYVHAYISPIGNIWANPGNVWGVSKETYHEIGSIPDICTLGGCDNTINFATFESHSEWNYAIPPPYHAQLMVWVEPARKVLKGKSTFVRGHVLHIEHEHFFNYYEKQKELTAKGISLANDFARDENFTIFLTNPYFRQFLP